MQETASGHIYDNPVFKTADVQAIDGSYRRRRLARQRTKTGKIMPPDEDIGSLLHRDDIKRISYMPDKSGDQRWSRGPVQNYVAVGALDRRETGTPRRIADHAGGEDHNRVGLHMKIQPIAHRMDVKPIRQINQDDLTCRVHAGIGSARRDARCHSATAQTSRRLLHDLLYRDAVYLSLPSDERTAIILEFKGE
jgi:hypothetical protein